MVCTAKGIDVIVPMEVRGLSVDLDPQLGEDCENGQGCRRNSQGIPRPLGPNRSGTHARNSIPMASLEAPSSRSWKPSPVHWATRWPGN